MTLIDQQKHLVTLAHQMNFPGAEAAYWDSAYPESGMDDLFDSVENGDPGEVFPIDLGVYLHKTVYPVCRWSDGCGGDEGGEIEYECFDTAPEARAWATEKEKP